MKKLFISLISLGIIFIPLQSHAGFWDDLGNSLLGGAGIGVDTNNDGTQDVEDSINNWAGGIGEDIVTDLFGNTGVGPIPDGQFTLPCPEVFNGIAQNTSIRQYALNIIKWVLGFLGLLAVIMIIYGGLLYITDGGEGSNVEKAKKILLYSVIGILIIFAAYPIVNTVIGIASTGEEPVAGQPLYVASNQNSDLSLTEACELQQNANVRPWFGWDWVDSNIQQIRTNVIKVPKGTPIIFNIKESDLGAGTYTPDVNFVYWHFGDGNDWTISTPKSQLSITKTFFESGKFYVSAVIEDDKGTRHRLLTQIVVGDLLEAEFTASTYFPASGQTVQFDATPTKVHYGSIAEYEWTVSTASGTGTCPNIPENSPIVSATFYGDELDCLVKLTVRSDILDVSGNSFGASSYEEIIEVSIDPEDNPDGLIPTPEMNYIQMTVDPYETGKDNLVAVRVEAWDEIDEPLKNYRFEVFESGALITTRSVSFGVNVDNTDDRPSGVTKIPVGKNGSFSEAIFDFSAYKGVHNYLFRTTVTNSFGRTDSIDSEILNITVSNGNVSPTAVIYTNLDIGNTEDEFIFRSNVSDVDGDELTYKWIYPNGISTEIREVPSGGELEPLTHNFTTSGNKRMTLWVSDGVTQKEIYKSVFVGNGVVNVAPEIISIVAAPATLVPINTIISFYPQVVDVNGDALTYKWDFAGEGMVETRNAAFKFSEPGEKDIVLTVSDGEVETEKTLQVSIYDPENPNDGFQEGDGDSIQSNTYIDRLVSNTEIGRAGETAFDFGLEFKDEKGVSVDAKSNFTYSWNLGDGSSLKTTEEVKNYVFEEKGNYRGSVSVNTGDAQVRRLFFLVEVIGADEVMPNRSPSVREVSVSPRSYGKIGDEFELEVSATDPDGDSLNYAWKENGVLTSKTGKRETFSFASNGYQELEVIVSDGRGKKTIIKKVINVNSSGGNNAKAIQSNTYIDRLVSNTEIGRAGETAFDFGLEFKDEKGVSVDAKSNFTYSWNLGDGSSLKTTEEVKNYVFEEKGNYRGSVSVNTGDAQVRRLFFLVEVIGADEVMPNRSPSVREVSVSPRSYGKIGDEFELEVSATDPDGDSLNYAWKENGVLTSKTGKRETFSFASNGYQELEVIVSDGRGKKTIIKKVINVNENGSNLNGFIQNNIPVIKYIVKEPGIIARVGEEFIFTPEIKSEESLDYVWDFGNGKISEKLIGKQTYSKAGNYVIKFTVSDESDNKIQEAFAIQVVGKNATLPNRMPIIKSITVLPKSYGKPDEPFTFLVDGYDPDVDNNVEYVWKTDAGKIVKGTQVSLSFEREGYHVVTLTASDGLLENVMTKVVYINKKGLDSPTNQIAIQNKTPQILDIISTPGEYIRLGETSEFEGLIQDESVDSLIYKWTFGDGTSSASEVASHTYSKAGQYLVKLNVIDDNGSIAQKAMSVRVFGPDEAMPNRAPVIKQVLVLPQNHGKIGNEFLFKSLVVDADEDEIEFKWETIDGIFGTESSASIEFDYLGYKTVYLTASDGKDVVNRMVNIYISNNGEPIENAPNGWQEQYLELISVIDSLEQKQAELVLEQAVLLEEIVNEDDEEKREQLLEELQAVTSEIETIQNNISAAEQSIEAIKSEKTTSGEETGFGAQSSEAKIKAEVEAQIVLLDDLIEESIIELNKKAVAVETLEKESLNLWKQLVETDDPVERAKIKELLKKSFAKLKIAKNVHIQATEKEASLKKERSFLAESLDIKTTTSRVEQQREIQKIRRIIEQLSYRKDVIEQDIRSLELDQSDLINNVSAEGNASTRSSLQTKIDSMIENKDALYDELLSVKKSIAGMEAESLQKEANLYVSSIQTKEAIDGKIKKLKLDLKRIQESLEQFTDNFLTKKIERTSLEKKLLTVDNLKSREVVAKDMQLISEKIIAINKGIATQEKKAQYFERAIDRLKTQSLNIVGNGYEIGIKNKEELQQKLEGNQLQATNLEKEVTVLKTSRNKLSAKRDVLIKELEKEMTAVEKSILLEKIKQLDIELFELDKKLLAKESSLEIVMRSQLSLKKDLFGSVSSIDLSLLIKNLDAEKSQAELFKDKFRDKLKEKRVARKSLLGQLRSSIDTDVFDVITQELENIEIYEKNIDQFGLVFELGTVIQHDSFPEESLDFSKAEETIYSNKESAMTDLLSSISEADQAIFLPLYHTITADINNLERRVLEQSDTIDLIELKRELLRAAMEDEKIIFEERIKDKLTKVGELKNSIITVFDERLVLEEEWQSARKSLMLKSKSNAVIVKLLESLHSKILKKDFEIEKIKAEIFSLIVQIDAYYDLLDKYFVIKGTVDTKFFLYGRLPNNSAQALFIEWNTGDGRVVYGQNAIISYDAPGRYIVRMNVTDGINTSTDSIVIKVENK